jgi:hypothetical protein
MISSRQVFFKNSGPVEASPVSRERKILLNIVENKKCRFPRLLMN